MPACSLQRCSHNHQFWRRSVQRAKRAGPPSLLLNQEQLRVRHKLVTPYVSPKTLVPLLSSKGSKAISQKTFATKDTGPPS